MEGRGKRGKKHRFGKMKTWGRRRKILKENDKGKQRSGREGKKKRGK